MANRKEPLPPYASPVTFNNFLGRLGSDPPQVIDRLVWGNWMSGASANQVMNAMRFLDLVSEDNRSYEGLRQILRSEGAERKKVLREILERSYPWLFDGSIDLKSATAMQLDEKFKARGAQGIVLQKCEKFFTQLAQEAGIPLSQYITKRRKPRKRSRRRKHKAIAQEQVSPQVDEEVPATTRRKGKSLEDKFLEMMPEFDPGWSAEERKVWNEQLRELYTMMKHREEEPPE